MKYSFTICSVSHSARSKRELDINADLVRSLNPDAEFSWLAADNAPAGSRERIDNPRFDVFEGAGENYWNYRRGWASLRHATALNALVRRIRTRFLIILDPDFYVIRPHWIRDILAHMQNQGLAFFGNPCNPKYYTKFRYFPFTHCFFADLERVPAAELDFRPAFDDPSEIKIRTSAAQRFFRVLPKPAERLALALTFQDRKFIGDSRDTCWRMYKKFYRHPIIRTECLQPVFRPREDFGRMARRFFLPNAALEYFLPDRLCFIPKDKRSYSTVTFHDLGYPDVRLLKWEEYLWQGKPFALHLRGTRIRGENLEEQMTTLYSVLDQCIQETL